jgi:hypothetical protein
MHLLIIPYPTSNLFCDGSLMWLCFQARIRTKSPLGQISFPFECWELLAQKLGWFTIWSSYLKVVSGIAHSCSIHWNLTALHHRISPLHHTIWSSHKSIYKGKSKGIRYNLDCILENLVVIDRSCWSLPSCYLLEAFNETLFIWFALCISHPVSYPGAPCLWR